MARYRSFDAARSVAGTAPPLSPELRDVQARRAGLKSALSQLELALAAPAPHRVEWVGGVRDALHVLHDVWTRHIVETEAPGAFLDELVAEAPRLSKPASHLRRDHSDILAALMRAERRLEDAPDTEPSYSVWADDMRTELTTVLSALARHRQRGADLVYEAYDVDLGGGF